MKRSSSLRTMATMVAVFLFTLAVGACGDDDDGPTNPAPQDPPFVAAISDYNYIRGQYFFLVRPAETVGSNSIVLLNTVRIFVDDRNGSNNQGAREGVASVDPTQVPAGADSLSGFFDQMQELNDFQITTSLFGDRYPVIIFTEYLSNSMTLAVTYDEDLGNGSVRTVGSVPAGPGERVHLKLLQVPRNLLKDSVTDPGFFEDDPAIDPFAPTRDYEIKSFYDLQERNIDPASVEITICRGTPHADTVSAYIEGAQRFPYLRILGGDLFTDDGTGTALNGADGVVDQFFGAWFIDSERGVLYFPDLRPFDPRISPRPDARPEEDLFFRSRISANTAVPGLRGRVLWPPGATGVPGIGGVTPAGLEANRALYDRRLIAAGDQQYYIRVVFPHREALAGGLR